MRGRSDAHLFFRGRRAPTAGRPTAAVGRGNPRNRRQPEVAISTVLLKTACMQSRTSVFTSRDLHQPPLFGATSVTRPAASHSGCGTRNRRNRRPAEVAIPAVFSLHVGRRVAHRRHIANTSHFEHKCETLHFSLPNKEIVLAFLAIDFCIFEIPSRPPVIGANSVTSVTCRSTCRAAHIRVIQYEMSRRSRPGDITDIT